MATSTGSSTLPPWVPAAATPLEEAARAATDETIAEQGRQAADALARFNAEHPLDDAEPSAAETDVVAAADVVRFAARVRDLAELAHHHATDPADASFFLGQIIGLCDALAPENETT